MLKEKIINYSKTIGIDVIGFTDADLGFELKEKLTLQENLGYKCSFQKGTIEERINPKLLLDDVKTIIAIAIAYPKTCDKLENISKNEVYFSSSSWGKDYHQVLKEKMKLLVDYIIKLEPSLKYKMAVDTAALCDRTIAYKAGLGFFGKNGLLINDNYGSYIFLGSLLTNLDLSIDYPIDKKCLSCNKCILACPTGAISDKGIINSSKCLSYITQKKGELTEEEALLINNCIYGCDICMRICPHNQNNYEHNAEFLPTDIEFVNIDQHVPLTNKEFKERFGHIAGSWRGASIINRNIKLYKDSNK
jgi:epoxyqueuosine reductase